jgi:hypothetical protein
MFGLACAGVKQTVLAKCAGGRCGCAVFVARRARASGWLLGSLCLMGDDSVVIQSVCKWQ